MFGSDERRGMFLVEYSVNFLWGFKGALCLERMCIMGVLDGK